MSQVIECQLNASCHSYNCADNLNTLVAEQVKKLAPNEFVELNEHWNARFVWVLQEITLFQLAVHIIPPFITLIPC